MLIKNRIAQRRLDSAQRSIKALFIGLLCVGFGIADAAELRVVDALGLVRAVKVVRGPARIVISLQSPNGHVGAAVIRGECIAVNTDGLAAERKTNVSSRNECIFDQMSEGSWQIRVPEAATWKAQVYE